jgi:predicted HTH domain antitoxin
MTSKEELRSVASEIPIFNNIEQKETFLFVIGALFSRVISFKKAAEIMGIEPDVFLQLLDLMGLEFCYLTVQDIAIEKDW